MSIVKNDVFKTVIDYLRTTGDKSKFRSSDSDIYKEFIKKYPKEKLKNLNLAEYCIGSNAKERGSFCWWIERGLESILGRYAPGNSTGHLMYFKQDGSVYKNRHLLAMSDEDALAYILKIQSTIASADVTQDIGWIDDDEEIYKRAKVQPLITVGPGRKLRLLSCYFPEDVLSVSSSEHLEHFLKIFGVDQGEIPPYNKPIKRMLRLLEFFKAAQNEVPGLSMQGFMNALYSPELAISPEKKNLNATKEIEGFNMPTSPSNLRSPLNQILYGPPGTGKTYNTINRSLEITGESLEGLGRMEIKELFDQKVSEGIIAFTTFHQSMSYEDFIEGIKPKLPEVKGGPVTYDVELGIFRRLCKLAESRPESRHVLIIDEINRGNVSSIFGELITLIEEDKRLGGPESLKVILPYSKSEFGVPNNLYILGTMNTADRSVEALDAALRRRFSFQEMRPQKDLLESSGKLKHTKGDCEGVNIASLLEVINKRIERLIDSDHQIGHSFLMNVSNLSELRFEFKNKIIPLLQEYFFGDVGKISLVLGDEFLESTKEEGISFAKSDQYDSSEFEGRIIYNIKDIDSIPLNEFKAMLIDALEK